jgi:hypothetical protein
MTEPRCVMSGASVIGRKGVMANLFRAAETVFTTEALCSQLVLTARVVLPLGIRGRSKWAREGNVEYVHSLLLQDKMNVLFDLWLLQGAELFELNIQSLVW